ncbi:unnamed protein product, partial [Mesorhabditis spiculigera]
MDSEGSDVENGMEHETVEVYEDGPIDQQLADGDGEEEGEAEPVQDDAIKAIYGHEKDVFCVSTSKTGRWLATGGEDDRAQIWDLTNQSDDPVLTIQHNDSVVSTAFNHSSTLLATADLSGRIVITQLSDLSMRTEIADSSDIEWMEWHRGSDILFAGDSDGTLWMWLISQAGVAQQKVYSAGSSPASAGHLLQDGRRLLVGYSDGQSKLWNLGDQSNCSLSCRSPVVAITSSTVSPLAAIGYENGNVFLVNTTPAENAGGGTLRVLDKYLAPGADTRRRGRPEDPEMEVDEAEEIGTAVESLQFSALHPWLAVGRNDGSVTVYDTQTQGMTRFSATNEGGMAVCRLFWLGYRLLTASVDGRIRLYDVRSGQMTRELCCGGDDILDMAIVEEEPQLKLVVACSGGAVRFMDC